jgi:hypothetical protein
VARKLTIRISAQPAITITRQATRSNRLVYIAKANKALKYPFGRSKIIYIGTTKEGVSRIAASAAHQARRLLDAHGVRSLEFLVVTCKSLQRVKTWSKLESALLITFKREFGAVPTGNTMGKNRGWRDELDYFTESRLRSVIRKYSH